jgi:hypothetical protein
MTSRAFLKYKYSLAVAGKSMAQVPCFDHSCSLENNINTIFLLQQNIYHIFGKMTCKNVQIIIRVKPVYKGHSREPE